MPYRENQYSGNNLVTNLHLLLTKPKWQCISQNKLKINYYSHEEEAHKIIIIELVYHPATTYADSNLLPKGIFVETPTEKIYIEDEKLGKAAYSRHLEAKIQEQEKNKKAIKDSVEDALKSL